MSARSDLAGGAGWMAFGLAILVGAWRMDRFEAMGATLYTAPGLVPGVFGLVLMLLGAALAWRGWRDRSPRDEAATAVPLISRRTVWTIVLALGYAAVLVGRAPFAPATAAFVALFTFVFSEAPSLPRRVGVAAASGVLTALAVVLVFERVFLVRLP